MRIIDMGAGIYLDGSLPFLCTKTEKLSCKTDFLPRDMAMIE